MLSGRIAVVLLLLAAARGNAQTRELEIRLDSLARVAQHTRTLIEAHDDSVTRASRALDTAYAGVPFVLAEPFILAQARAIAPRVVDSIASIIGPARSTVAGAALVIRAASRTSGDILLGLVAPDGARGRGWRAPADSASIAEAMGNAIVQAAFATSGPAFATWASDELPRRHPLSEAQWAHQRLLLIAARSAVGSRCFHGDLEACRYALLLTTPVDPVMQWHDSATRRELVRRRGTLARRIDAAAKRQCDAGSDSSCIRLLRQFPSGIHREPAPSRLRSDLLRHALVIGGSHAMERLLTAPDDPAQRLEAAAGVPLDTLLAGWQRRVRQTRAPSEDLSFDITLMALAWVTGLGALSLRSSRWR